MCQLFEFLMRLWQWCCQSNTDKPNDHPENMVSPTCQSSSPSEKGKTVGTIEETTEKTIEERIEKTIEETCPICLDSIVDDMFTTICKHKYHKLCLNSWLTKSQVCPLCRTNLSAPPDNPPDSKPSRRPNRSTEREIRNINRYITSRHLNYKTWSDTQPNLNAIYGIRSQQYNPYGLQTSLGYAPYP